MKSFTAAALILTAALTLSFTSLHLNRVEAAQAGYGQGTLTQTYDRNLITTYEATVKAMTDLGMTIRKSDKNTTEGFIEATRPDDMQPVSIRFKSHDPSHTVASIQVGAGDEPYSRVIAKRIDARLRG